MASSLSREGVLGLVVVNATTRPPSSFMTWFAAHRRKALSMPPEKATRTPSWTLWASSLLRAAILSVATDPSTSDAKTEDGSRMGRLWSIILEYLVAMGLALETTATRGGWGSAKARDVAHPESRLDSFS